MPMEANEVKRLLSCGVPAAVEARFELLGLSRERCEKIIAMTDEECAALCDANRKEWASMPDPEPEPAPEPEPIP